jgi:hypothetical protein
MFSIITVTPDLPNRANDWPSFGSHGRSLHPVPRPYPVENQETTADQPFNTLGNQQIKPVIKSPPPFGEPTQQSRCGSHIASTARTIAFIGDHRFPPPRPPSTNGRVFEVSSLSFAESFRTAMAMQRPKTDAAAPVAFQPISLDSFKETDAPVTSCEITYQKVDTTKVRKMRRRTPAPRKKHTLLTPAEQPPSSPQVLQSVQVTKPADSRHLDLPTPEPPSAPPWNGPLRHLSSHHEMTRF